MSRINATAAFLGLLAVAWLTMGGCVITITPEPTPPSTPTTITVRIVNSTTKPLDPQIYIAPVDVGVENMFQPVYKRTNFGFGGLGVLQPLTSESFTVTCGQLGLVGTDGGIAGDNLADPAVPKGQRFVLQEGVGVQCGYIVEFRFDLVGGQVVNGYAITAQGG